MLVPAIFDIISGSSMQKASNDYPFRPELIVFLRNEILFFRRPRSLLMGIDKVIVVSVPALPRVPSRHELAYRGPIVIAELENECS
jgi:hypothetical protein